MPSMSRPLIGITTDYNAQQTHYSLPYAYTHAVEKAGGIPVMLPYRMHVALLPDLIAKLDGLLLTGGDDLNPAAYGDAWHEKAERIDPARQSFEQALLAEAERRAIPTMGICLGCQAMNVYRGGSLHQFLPDLNLEGALEHRREDNWGKRHDVKIESGSLLSQTIGNGVTATNTSHKQAVKTPGRGLRIVAFAPDGVAEAIEDPSGPLFLGVQWHPERQADEPDAAKLFALLVERSRESSLEPPR